MLHDMIIFVHRRMLYTSSSQTVGCDRGIYSGGLPYDLKYLSKISYRLKKKYKNLFHMFFNLKSYVYKTRSKQETNVAQGDMATAQP